MSDQKSQPTPEEIQALDKKINQYKVKMLSDIRAKPPDDLDIRIELLPTLPAIVAHVVGNLVEDSAVYFYEKITPLYVEVDKLLIVCGGVEKIDTTGLAMLVDFFARTKRMEKHFSLVDPSEVVQKKIKESGLESIIPMNFTKFDQIEEAIG